MYSFINRFTSVNKERQISLFLIVYSFSFSYLHQFYSNFFHQKTSSCFFVYFAPHLLKTLELFNYTFNVFVSIVSGKHGRHELFDMLFCRTIPTQTIPFNTGSKLVPLSAHNSIVSSRSYSRQKSNHKMDKVTKPLLAIRNHKNNNNNHYHYQ